MYLKTILFIQILVIVYLFSTEVSNKVVEIKEENLDGTKSCSNDIPRDNELLKDDDHENVEAMMEALWEYCIESCEIRSNPANITFTVDVVDEFIELQSKSTNHMPSFFFTKLLELFKNITKEDMTNDCFIELLKEMKFFKLIGKYSERDVDEMIDRLEEIYYVDNFNLRIAIKKFIKGIFAFGEIVSGFYRRHTAIMRDRINFDD